ncbi:pentapeptide repeat-containing protein [Tychonema sp. LEGE 07203]|uniref:pentapeptide repeat-containing protein n=1 Tax=Tychonema sp. LEGE 07203 TaxID=1828671 RepID=UPI00187F07EA|nr:pentapeptide repeat-containing protein [Tychonema sp. LEGE 07203]MBE9096018.1 pentapeptide repeat-containing protein [Tychonema sp. LEGE 07203]
MKIRQLAALLFALTIFILPQPALAQSKYYDPPLSFSNAELSRRDFSGQMLRAAEFSNANMDLTNFSNADLRGAIMSASVMTKANLHGANLTNAMIDQVRFTQADLSDANLTETILLRSTFDEADITGADFTDAIMDGAQVKELCTKASGINSQTGISTRDSLGCR